MRLPVNRIALAFGALTLAGSGLAQAVTGPAADYPVVVGEPYVIDGKTFTPVTTLNYDAVGHATVAADAPAGVTAAHHTLPVPSYAEVTSLETGRTILVRIERRGPMNATNLIALSPGAAAQLGAAGKADLSVRVRRVNPPEVERAMLRSGQQAPARMDTPMSLVGVLKRKLDAQDGVLPAPVSTPEVAPSATPSTKTPVPDIAKAPPAGPKRLPGKPDPRTAPGVKRPAPEKPVEPPKPAPAGKTDAVAPNAADKPAIAAPAIPAAKPAQRYAVQIGTFANKTNAERAAAKLGTKALASGTMWRVRTGPYVSKAEAEAALAKVRAAGYTDARIQRAD